MIYENFYTLDLRIYGMNVEFLKKFFSIDTNNR